MAVQCALSLRLIWGNTAFEDEAQYLWAGHVELASWLTGQPAWDTISWMPTEFSGAPVIYPPLAEIANSIGGLVAARLLSLAFIEGATVLLWLTTRRLTSTQVAAAAAVTVWVLTSSVQFLSAFATFDAMALFLLTLATYLVARSPTSTRTLVLAGLVLALADATKYATALWDPVIAALVLVLIPGWKSALRYVACLTGCTALFLLLGLLAGGSGYWTGVTTTTLNRDAAAFGNTVAPLSVLWQSAQWIWPVVALALVAVILERNWLTVVLLIATLLAPLHQAQIETTVSLNKHVAFGAWFGCIAAGYAAMRIANAVRGHPARLTVAMNSAAIAAAVIAFTGIINARVMYQDWPDETKPIAQVEQLLPSHPCPCLMMSSEVYQYYLEDKLPEATQQSLIGSPYYIQYQVGNKTLTGTNAYVQAVRRHFYSIIELDDGENPPLDATLMHVVSTTEGYHLVQVTLWPGGGAWVYVYRRP